MIHSAKLAVSPVANIVFTLFYFARFWKVGTDVHINGRQWSQPAVTVGLAEWIKKPKCPGKFDTFEVGQLKCYTEFSKSYMTCEELLWKKALL